MRLISCASYYGSGSSAITDFVSEFQTVFSFTNEEFRFVHDPDGISDLEYNLVENFNRHNSGFAIKRYIKMMDYCAGIIRGYECFFHGNWKKYSEEYIRDLTEFTYHGWWSYDLYSRGKLYYLFKRIPNQILKKTIWRNQPERTLNNMKNEIQYCSHPSEDEFLYYTRKYIDNLFMSVSNGAEIVMVDQIVPSTNLGRYLRYFNDIKVTIVDRDPRDIFVLEKYVWKDGLLPSDVETFCKWYNYTRDHREQKIFDEDRVKFVQFEDLIYNYEKTRKELIEWLGLDEKDHTMQFKCFDPRKSIANTQTWKSYKCDINDIKYIEKNLPQYLYHY